jgi:hypothetical protein
VARFYADEDFPRPVVEALRLLGHDVLSVQEAGQAEKKIPDAPVSGFAHAHNRAVLTYNRRDFINLHEQSTDHSGVIVCTRDPNTAELALRIHDAIAQLRDLRGQLVRTDRPNRAREWQRAGKLE